MPIYRGVGGVNRQITNIYRGVNGVNREIQEQIRGVNGVNRVVHQAAWDGFKYQLGYDISNASKLTDGMVELNFIYSDGNHSLPYIMLYAPEPTTIDSLVLNWTDYNGQSNPNTNKYMKIIITDNSSNYRNEKHVYYEESNVRTNRTFDCYALVGMVISLTNPLRITLSGDRHRPESYVISAHMEIPNKSIVLNGRPIDFTKMTVK